MSKNFIEQLREINKHFPAPEPTPPSAFALGVAGELQALAAQIEAGELVITHFSLTAYTDSNKQRLEIEVA